MFVGVIVVLLLLTFNISEVESGTVSPGGTNNNNSSGSRSRGGMSRSVSVHLPSPTLNNNVSEMMNTIETLRKSKSIPYNIEGMCA